MNWNRKNPQDFFCYDSTSSGATGGAPSPSGSGGGGSAPAPGSPPAASPEGGAASSGSSSGTSDAGGSSTPAPASDQFAGLDGLDDDFDSIDLGDVSTGDGPGAATPDPAAPTAQPVKPAAEQPAPAAQADPAAAPAPAPAKDGTSASQSPLEQALEGFKANNAALSDWAAQNLFALSKEDAEALETDAVAMIPKLMGRLYAQVLPAAANLIRNFVPNMVQEGVQSHTATTTRSQEALNEFYSTNAHLNAKDHGAAVTKWAKAFRAANPKATRKEAIDYVGRAVSFEFGINPGAPKPAAPQSFAPAHSGARTPAPRSANDPYAGMEDDLD